MVTSYIQTVSDPAYASVSGSDLLRTSRSGDCRREMCEAQAMVEKILSYEKGGGYKAVLREVVSGHHERLGDAILAAQEAYVQTGAFPELLSIYHLFGDPALTLR